MIDVIDQSRPRIYTSSGLIFDLLDPRPEVVSLSDIAVSLRNIKRCTGHSSHGRRPWSVARHSLLVGLIVGDLVGYDDPKLQRTALMHDAPEAYSGDVSSPLKQALRSLAGNIRSSYDYIEHGIWLAIAEKFDLYVEMPPVIKQADLLALGIEVNQTFGAGMADKWGIPFHPRSFVPQTDVGFLNTVKKWL